MPKKTNSSNEKAKDFIAGLIALIFVVVAGYLALNKFNKKEDTELGTGGDDIGVENIDLEGIGDWDDISATSTYRADATEIDSTTDTYNYSVWTANDYEMGDISQGNYTVRSGDTLWELAEGVYGDGSMWTKILNANADNVGFLPDGSQALIITDQTLVIP